MKAVKLCLIVLIGAIVVNFIRGGRGFHIAKSLPFSNAPEPISQYDWAGVVMLVIAAWGLYRLNRRKKP